MVTLGEGRDTETINSQLLVVPFRSVYNYILGRAFTTTLDTIISLVNLKLKYHNVHDESITISVVMSWEKGSIGPKIRKM